MRLLTWVSVLVLSGTVMAAAPDHDALRRARRAYNEERYDAAIGVARNALLTPGVGDEAHLVLGRALLERYRASGEAADLEEARANLRALDPLHLTPADRSEWMVGFAQWLFFTNRYGAAAELFEDAAARPLAGGAAARDRLLDWWASALDRQAGDSPAERDRLSARILERMDAELQRDPGSVAANYWTVAAARSLGDLDRAWNASMAAWVRAALSGPHGGGLRTDIDRLVLTGIIPDRARVAAAEQGQDQRQAADTMVTEWERFKQEWERRGASPGPALTSVAAPVPASAPAPR